MKFQWGPPISLMATCLCVPPSLCARHPVPTCIEPCCCLLPCCTRCCSSSKPTTAHRTPSLSSWCRLRAAPQPLVPSSTGAVGQAASRDAGCATSSLLRLSCYGAVAVGEPHLSLSLSMLAALDPTASFLAQGSLSHLG
jgi:hypothetical protein